MILSFFLFAQNIEQLFFCLDTSREDISKVFYCLCIFFFPQKTYKSISRWYGHTQRKGQFFLKLVSPILNIGSLETFPAA